MDVALDQSTGSDAIPEERDLSGLRVALVHDWLTGLRGGEKCLESLCRIFPRATIHTLIHRRGATTPVIERMDIRTSPLQRLPGIHRHYRHLLPIMPMAARSWRVGDVDLVFSLSHCVAKAVRTPAGVPHISYCFTPMRYAWEGRREYFDAWAGRPVRRALAGALLDRLQTWDRATAARVTHFVAISETVRARIARCYGRESRVISPPVDTDYFTPDDDGPRDTSYLVVSALVPYKRIDHAVIASTRLGRPLLVIGSGPDRDRLERLAGSSVRFLGWQPDEVVRDQLRRCRALLFPGEEDFGIVPVEAMACGTPVIALGRGGAAESVDPRVGHLYARATPDALGEAMLEWEAAGMPHDAPLARHCAEHYSTCHFESRIRTLVGEVLEAGAMGVQAVPPPPHLVHRARPTPRFRTAS